MSRILIVDDDVTLLRVLRDWLVHSGYEVDAAARGDEAWIQMCSGIHDVIVLDWDLPDSSGLELLNKLREAGNSTPVIMLTGRRSIDDKTTGLDAGADDYLTKPFHLKELSARLKVLLRKSERSIKALPKPLGNGNAHILAKGELEGTSLASRYEFLEVIGTGGVGLVFKARHPQLQRLVAVKMLQKSSFDDEVLARFEQEARLISALDNPYIATVHDYGRTERGRPFMVLELVEGMNLSQLLEERGPLPFDVASHIITQVAEGLSVAHKSGVIHRDVKPSNIMLKTNAEQQLTAKIVDFGCAKQHSLTPEDASAAAQGKEVALEEHSSPSITQTGTVVGTPYYMSPEQALGRPVNHRADIYALGCILYETLTGCVPYVGLTNKEVLIKHVRDEALPMSAHKADVPADFQTVVNKALAKKPDSRYQTMQEFKLAVEQACANASGETTGKSSRIWDRLRIGITAKADDKKTPKSG